MGEMLCVHIPYSVEDQALIDACRRAWRANPKRVEKVKHVAAVTDGKIINVFDMLETKPSDAAGRIELELRRSPTDVQQKFIGRNVKIGRNPVHYIPE